MAITEDVSTPAVVHSPYGTTGTGTTALFSPPAGSLVVVAAIAGYSAHTGDTGASTPLSCADSLSNSYAVPVFVNSSSAGTHYWNAAWFAHYYASAPGSITVTVTNSNVTSAILAVVPRVLTGASASQAGAATGTNNTGLNPAPSGSVTTTTAGGWVYVLGSAASNDGPAPLSGTTTIDNYVVFPAGEPP